MATLHRTVTLAQQTAFLNWSAMIWISMPPVGSAGNFSM
jgi:hypothetical protein